MKLFAVILFVLIPKFLFAIEFSIDNKSIYGIDLQKKLIELSKNGLLPYDKAFKSWEKSLNFNEYFNVSLNKSLYDSLIYFHIYSVSHKKSLELVYPSLEICYSEFEKTNRFWGNGEGVPTGLRVSQNKKSKVNERLICWDFYFDSLQFIKNFKFNVVRILSRFEKSILTISFEATDKDFCRFLKELDFNKVKFLKTFDSMPENDDVIIELQRDLSKTERYVIRFSVPKKIISKDFINKYSILSLK